MVYFLKLLTHIQWGIYSYILFGTPGLLPQDFETYLIWNVLMYLLWSSWSTSQAFNTYLIRNILIYPRWRTHHIEEHSPNMYRDNPNREIHELRLWHWRGEDTTSRVSSRGKLSTPGPPRTHTYMVRIAIARYITFHCDIGKLKTYHPWKCQVHQEIKDVWGQFLLSGHTLLSSVILTSRAQSI